MSTHKHPISPQPHAHRPHSSDRLVFASHLTSGVSSRRRILTAVGLFLLLILFGTGGYVLIEPAYSWFDAFYMTVITITTVGFGEIKPLSTPGRLFTTVLIVIGFSSLAYIAHSLVESLLETFSGKSSETKKMRTKIDKLHGHYIICGFGRVGEAAAQHFAKAGADYVIVEADQAKCQELHERKELFVEGDATHEDALLAAGIKRAAGLLAMLNTDPENLFIVLSARELNPTLRIFSRLSTPSSARKIIQAGADQVISPYKSAGRQVADDIMRATGRASLFDSPPAASNAPPSWYKVNKSSSLAGKTIQAAAESHNATILGLRREGQDTIQPDPQTILHPGDQLLMQDGRHETGSAEVPAHAAPPRKIVIIDDNPVIIRLYNRLFQKAGFHPLCASSGKEGLQLIINEEPTAAVIDYHLPDLSGIEICREIRKISDLGHVQLIIFTADEHQEVRNQALAAGASEVVVKSADAAAIIDRVIHHLGAAHIHPS